MINTDLIKILSALDKKGRKRFLQFLESPYYNTHLPTAKLGRYLLKEIDKNGGLHLDKNQILNKLFPNKEDGEAWLYNMLSKILKLAVSFIGLNRQSEKSMISHYHQIQGLIELELPQYCNKVEKDYTAGLAALSTNQSEQFLEHYFFQEALDSQFVAEGLRKDDIALLEKNLALDSFYLAQKLRITCDMLSRNEIINTNYQTTAISFLKNQSEKLLNEENKIQSFLIYYHALSFMENRDDKQAFYAFTQMLEERKSDYPVYEKWILYNYALNHCIRKINTGNPDFYIELHRLYLSMLQDGTLTNKGHLTQWDFKNIVTVGLRIHDFDWTEQFIKNYASYLHPEEKENALSFNLASLYLAKKDFVTALRQLQEVEFTDPAYHLGAKIIQIKCYFELKEEDAFLSLVEAFKKYINRNRILGSYKKLANKAFLRFTGELFDIYINKHGYRNKEKVAHLDALHKKLENETAIANKDWLFEKLADLSALS